MSQNQTPNEDSRAGFFFALAAYSLWGFLPLYMKQLSHIPAAEIVAHRIIWSVPIAGAILVIIGRTKELRAALASPRMLAQGALTAALVSVNWGTYVWAITHDRALDAALGYYINPLFSVFLGAVLLRERLARLQLVAIAIATLAVLILTWEAGSLPWVALILTFSWGFYAFFRKTLPIGPNQGFFLEVLILLIPSIAYAVYVESNGDGHFVGTGLTNPALLFGAGVATAIPLMIYANGAKRLRLSTIAMMQYLAPTMIFLTAVFIFGEPFPPTKLVAFCMIWAGLVLFTYSIVRRPRAPTAELAARPEVDA